MGFIYKITNTVNGKIYIGQTHRTIAERWQEHCTTTHDTAINRAFKKYGLSKFSISEVEECSNEILDEREIYWINYYNSYNNGYNSTIGGGGAYKYSYLEIANTFIKTNSVAETANIIGCSSETVKKALRANNLEYALTSEIEIEMIDPETLVVLKSFKSLTEATKYNSEWQIGTLSGAVSGYRNSAYGYFWRKKGDNDKTFEPLFKQKRKIGQYDKNTNELLNIFESAADANRFFGKKESHRSISNSLCGYSKTAFGYIWKYLD